VMPSKPSYSQHGEDLFILRHLSDSSARFVVDVGANDGYSWSNSYMFGLRGFALLLVEPMPLYAERCRTLYRDRPDVHIEQAAITSSGAEFSTFHINLDTENDLLAMRSSVIRESIPSSKLQAITVPSCSLSSLLEKYDVPHQYALLTVDAEGMDLEVLRTAKLEVFRPQFICVEEEVFGDAIANYLRERGYRRIETLGPNGIYTA
jgi:FkbM family methyltransferase